MRGDMSRIACHVGSMRLEGEHFCDKVSNPGFSLLRGFVSVDALLKDGEMGNTSARESGLDIGSCAHVCDRVSKRRQIKSD